MPVPQGHEQGFKTHKFLEEGTTTEICILFSSETVNYCCLRAPTLFEICRSVEVARSSIIVFLNLADCDTCTCMQCSDKVTGTFIGTQKCKCMHVHVYEPLMTCYTGFLANCLAWAAWKLAVF